MYQKILVPLDGSQRAEAIIPHVENLAKHEGAKVIFVRVVEPATRSAVLDPRSEKEVTFKAQQVEQVEQYLASWRERFRAKNLSAETLMMRGVPVDAIIHALEIKQADLLAMTSKGETGLARIFHGSVAAGVLNRVRCPFLLARSETQAKLGNNNRILVPLDGSQRAEVVIPHVDAIARLYNAKITLLRVVVMPHQTAAYIDLGQGLEERLVPDHLFNQLGKHQEIQRVQEARTYLFNRQNMFQKRGFEVEVKLLYGKPIESITRVAEDIDANLITLTNQGRTGLDRVFYGSVASGLIHHLARPLLIIPTGEAPIRNFA